MLVNILQIIKIQDAGMKLTVVNECLSRWFIYWKGLYKHDCKKRTVRKKAQRAHDGYIWNMEEHLYVTDLANDSRADSSLQER